MIKINLLDSVTDRQAGATTTVDRKVSSPLSKLILMAVAVTALLITVVGWDVISTSMAKTQAEKDLAEQQEIAKQLEAVMKEQKELDAKRANIEKRIKAIKDLRASQAGPSAVLEALRERISMTPGIYLESVDQKGDVLTIKGSSPDESAVARFGGSLEFSGGLFSNLGIETQRKDMPGVTPVANDPNSQVPQIVNFTIRCAYTPSKAGNGNGNSQMTAGNTQPNGAPQPNGQPAPNGAPQPNAPQSNAPNPPTAAAQPTPAAANQPAPQVAKN